jgi:hypothetical protein
MSDHKNHLMLSSAALQDIISCGASYNAAALRADRASMEDARTRAHAHLDAYLDHFGSAAAAMRKISERE